MTPRAADVLPRAARVVLEADVEGFLLRRYKRFFADVETADGRKLTVHCPNPGSMKGLLVPGAPVRCSTSDNPRRKLRHTLEMIRIGRSWVGLHTGRANALAEAALVSGRPEALAGYARRRAEVRVEHGAETSRLDFHLSGHEERPDAWLEIKSVTLAEGRTGRFPDSVTARGRKHAELLGSLAAGGERAVLLFVVQRGDVRVVEPADDLDPAYGRALRDAVDRGVEVLALGARVTPRALLITRELPVSL